MADARDVVWRFVRGDDSPQGFEYWLYENAEDSALAELLGNRVLLMALGTSFGNRLELDALRQVLREAVVPKSPPCACLSWRDEQRLPLGMNTQTQETESVDEFLSRFDVIRRTTPWLNFVRCRTCRTHWYIGVDTVDDEYRLHRLTQHEVAKLEAGDRIAAFKHFERVWPTKDWLKMHGYSSLAEWQEAESRAT